MEPNYVALNSAQAEAERDPFTRKRYAQFARHLKFGTREVLDVGCANGRGGVELTKRRPEIVLYGLDCVQDRLDRLPPAYQGRICSFTSNIDAGDESFDAIVAGEFIEHLNYADVLATLSEFARLIRPGGQLLMTTPYPDYLRLLPTGKETVGGAHLSAHYPKQLKVMLADAGFENIHWRPSGGVTRVLGDRLPLMWLYGSFLIVGTRMAGSSAAGT